MPYLIKQLERAENCLTREEAQKILRKVERLKGGVYVPPKNKKLKLKEVQITNARPQPQPEANEDCSDGREPKKD